MEATMTIGDFARRTGLSISALRFYAGRGLLVPDEIDASTGYRRYSDAQVPDGRLVRIFGGWTCLWPRSSDRSPDRSPNGWN